MPDLVKDRQQKLFTWRAENLITIAELIAYGSSQHIEEVKAWVDELVQGTITVDCLTLDQCCAIRDYLIVLLVIVNALRCSNILNFSVKVS